MTEFHTGEHGTNTNQVQENITLCSLILTDETRSSFFRVVILDLIVNIKGYF